jgi:hypothetical protein
MDGNNLQELQGYIVVSVVLGCNIIGYLIKHYIPKINKKYIPLIMLLCGIVINVIITLSNGAPIDAIVIISGAVSGLASTGTYEAATGSLGLHKVLAGIFAKKEEEENEEPETEKSKEASEEEVTDEGSSKEGEDSSEEVTDEEPKEE